MSENRIAASSAKRASGCNVTSAASSGFGAQRHEAAGARARGVVFRKIAAGLPHQPDRRVRRLARALVRAAAYRFAVDSSGKPGDGLLSPRRLRRRFRMRGRYCRAEWRPIGSAEPWRRRTMGDRCDCAASVGRRERATAKPLEDRQRRSFAVVQRGQRAGRSSARACTDPTPPHASPGRKSTATSCRARSARPAGVQFAW